MTHNERTLTDAIVSALLMMADPDDAPGLRLRLALAETRTRALMAEVAELRAERDILALALHSAHAELRELDDKAEQLGRQASDNATGAQMLSERLQEEREMRAADGADYRALLSEERTEARRRIAAARRCVVRTRRIAETWRLRAQVWMPRHRRKLAEVAE